MTTVTQDARDVLAQWAFDTRPVLGRFHIWLEGVETDWIRGKPTLEDPRPMSFVDGKTERQLAMTAAVTALGTRLYGRFGEGAGKAKPEINEVKKDADAVSAYAMSEGLWYLTRHLPENHAIMVCLGEGLMPKAGETPEMGSNPQLGFGRVYARPEVAQWLDDRVHRLLNDPSYGWSEFYGEIRRSGITVWGAAIDTLENTSRFALGREAGTMTILHVFDQPLHILRPYEGYMGTLLLPRAVKEAAARRAILLDYRTPRSRVMESIQAAYPGIRPEHVHVWTLAGKSRETRLNDLWGSWKELGVHLVEEGWTLPTGHQVFTESGTYAPTHSVGTWQDEEGNQHLFIVDGYAASAEAMQAASLAPSLNLEASLAVMTSKFKQPSFRECDLMRLQPDAPDFPQQLSRLLGEQCDGEKVEQHRQLLREPQEAGVPLRNQTLGADDFFPEKVWDMLAISGFMGVDPYTGLPGVEKLADDRYRVTVRLVSQRAEKHVRLELRLMEPSTQQELVFSPLLNRFLAGEETTEQRAVKISDSGRIRNELQTLCAEAIEFLGGRKMRLHFDRIPESIMDRSKRQRLRQLLEWYKGRHPLWFSWLELA